MCYFVSQSILILGDFRNNKISTDDFKNLIKEMMTVFFRNALLVIEKNSYGLVIIDGLIKDPNIEPRMYRENKETLGEKQTNNGFTVKSKRKTVMYGVDTNSVTRRQMFDLLPEIVETEYDKLISPHIYSDIANLEKKRNGKIEHAANAHDDNLMSYLIFRWAVFYGKCFKDKFGISPIPSRANVRVVSSTSNMSIISGLIESANAASIAPVRTPEGNMMYNTLLDQTRKMESDENKQLNSFLKITNMNKD